MASDWEKLANDWEGNDAVFIGEADCSLESNEEICSGIEQLPTLRYGEADCSLESNEE